MNQNKKNVAHSIFQRLLNRAKTNKEDFNLLLSRYGMERFLYRLSVSPHNDRFILKGPVCFWSGKDKITASPGMRIYWDSAMPMLNSSRTCSATSAASSLTGMACSICRNP